LAEKKHQEVLIFVSGVLGGTVELIHFFFILREGEGSLVCPLIRYGKVGRKTAREQGGR